MSSLVSTLSCQINFENTSDLKQNNKNKEKEILKNSYLSGEHPSRITDITKQIYEINNLNGKLNSEDNEISTTNNTTQNPSSAERLRKIPPIYLNNTDIVLLRVNELDKIEKENRINKYFNGEKE